MARQSAMQVASSAVSVVRMWRPAVWSAACGSDHASNAVFPVSAVLLNPSRHANPRVLPLIASVLYEPTGG
mgnify:CR=1 FL=1